MLSDAQKIVFKQVADNKAVFECLKEYLEEKMSLNELPMDMTNADLGAYVMARYDTAGLIRQAFKEIAAYKTLPTEQTGGNPAR